MADTERKNQMVTEDEKFKSLLQHWEAPDVPTSLDARMMASFRQQIARQPFWKRWLTMSFVVPMPVAAAAAVCLVIWLAVSTGLLLRRPGISSGETASLAKPNQAAKVIEVPVPREVVKEKVVEKVVTRTVYVEKAHGKTNKGTAPAPSIERSEAGLDILDGGPPKAGRGTTSARDFTLEDVTLTLRSPKILVNGKPATDEAELPERCSGPLLWVSIPRYGRMICSMAAHPGYGFQKIGIVEGRTISVALDGNSYEWISSAPIIGSAGKWNLWVLREPVNTQNPEGKLTIGSADRMEQLLHAEVR